MLSVAEPFYLWFRIGKESFVYKNFPLFPAPSLLLLSFIICGESVCNRNRTEANIENQKSAAFLFNFSFCMFLKEGREKASRISDGDHSESTIYAAIRHQPRPKPEDVMYVNIQPSPKVSFLQEPPGSSHPSWPVEYATLIFKDTTPQSEIEERRTGPLKESSTKPSAYWWNAAELSLETTRT